MAALGSQNMKVIHILLEGEMAITYMKDTKKILVKPANDVDAFIRETIKLTATYGATFLAITNHILQVIQIQNGVCRECTIAASGHDRIQFEVLNPECVNKVEPTFSNTYYEREVLPREVTAQENDTLKFVYEYTSLCQQWQMYFKDKQQDELVIVDTKTLEPRYTLHSSIQQGYLRFKSNPISPTGFDGMEDNTRMNWTSLS